MYVRPAHFDLPCADRLTQSTASQAVYRLDQAAYLSGAVKSSGGLKKRHLQVLVINCKLLVCTWAQDERPADLHMAQPNVPVSKTGQFPPAKLVRGGLLVGWWIFSLSRD
jgi:hypothetical protein